MNAWKALPQRNGHKFPFLLVCFLACRGVRRRVVQLSAQILATWGKVLTTHSPIFPTCKVPWSYLLWSDGDILGISCVRSWKATLAMPFNQHNSILMFCAHSLRPQAHVIMYKGSHPNPRQARKQPKLCSVNFFFMSFKFFLTPLGFFGGTWGCRDSGWFLMVLFEDFKACQSQYTNTPVSFN